MAIVSHDFDHVVGVDTHAQTHTFVILESGTGAKLATETFPTTTPGMKRALAWIHRHASGSVLAAVEGTGSYGARLAGVLDRGGLIVAEMDVPIKHYRKRGKSDPLDAESAARRALASTTEQLSIPRAQSGDRVALQILLTARKSLLKSRTQATNQLTALLRIHDLDVDARRALKPARIHQIATWRTRHNEDTGVTAARAEATRLATEIRRRDTEIAANKTQLRQHAQHAAPALLELVGVGPIVAAQLIVSYSHKGRIRSEAAFARLAGSAPIPASSGNTERHRLHRGGDRDLNSALWRIVFYRTHHQHPETLKYIEQHLAKGQTPREITRALKRFVARSIFRTLEQTMP